MSIIESTNFDRELLKILKRKKGKNIVSGRFNMENVRLPKKADFIISFFSSLKSITGITYKVLFWDQDYVITEFFEQNFERKEFDISVPYKNGKRPGILFVTEKEMDEFFLRLLLEHHFNYELGKDPSLNLRVQIAINQETFIVLLDIYDDRGLDIYYLNFSELG